MSTKPSATQKQQFSLWGAISISISIVYIMHAFVTSYKHPV